MPAVPVFAAQLLARFFFVSESPSSAFFFDDRPVKLLDGEGQAKRALSGLP